MLVRRTHVIRNSGVKWCHSRTWWGCSFPELVWGGWVGVCRGNWKWILSLETSRGGAWVVTMVTENHT